MPVAYEGAMDGVACLYAIHRRYLYQQAFIRNPYCKQAGIYLEGLMPFESLKSHRVTTQRYTIKRYAYHWPSIYRIMFSRKVEFCYVAYPDHFVTLHCYLVTPQNNPST